MGFITRGFGVSIHKQSCANAVASMKDPSNAPRWVKAYWADSVRDSYKAGLEIIALNRNAVSYTHLLSVCVPAVRWWLRPAKQAAS